MKLTLKTFRPSDLDREDLRPFVVVGLSYGLAALVVAAVVVWRYV